MNEPTRLLDMPESELERALLDAGRSYTASSSVRSKTLLALGLTAVTTSAAPPAVAAGSSLTKATLSKVAAVALAIGAVAVPVWRYLQHSGPSADVSRPSVRPAPTSPTAAAAATIDPAPDSAASTEPAAPSAIERATPEASARRTSPTARSSSRSEVKAPTSPTLSAELAALDTARTSLAASDAAGALAALDSYARTFPRGRLKLEAEVLRIGALAKSGQTDVARKRAEAFLRLHPDSVLASRVRGYAGL